MRFGGDRHWWTRAAAGAEHSLEGRWLPLLALGGTLVALVFSCWRFEPADDLAEADAAEPTATRPADFHQLPAVHVRLVADAAGRLAAIALNGRAVRDAAELRAQIKTFLGPAADATVAAELNCDGNLRYEETQRLIAAISNYPSPDGLGSVPLVDRVTFLPRRSQKH